MAYRAETYFAFISMHKSDILVNIKSNRLYFLLLLAGTFGFALYIQASLFTLIIFLACVVLFFLAGYSLIFYLFPMSIQYQVYRRSSQQYRNIEKDIIKTYINQDTETSHTEITILDHLRHFGDDIQDIVSYDFEKADIFITKHSFFFFPTSFYYKKDSKLRITRYLPPIRFNSNKEEIITGIDDLHTINDFKITNMDELVFEFKDPKYQNFVKIKIKT